MEFGINKNDLHKRLDLIITYPVNTKHLYSICTVLDVVQMLYKCFVFTGAGLCPLTLKPLSATIVVFNVCH